MANPSRMNKADLIVYAKEQGVNVGKQDTKKEILALLKSKPKTKGKVSGKAGSTPKAKGKPKTAKPNKIVGKPVSIPQAPKKGYVASTTNKHQEKSIWQTIKDFFGV